MKNAIFGSVTPGSVAPDDGGQASVTPLGARNKKIAQNEEFYRRRGLNIQNIQKSARREQKCRRL